MTNAPRRILVVRTDRLGDVVLTLPMFAYLRRRFPDARLAFLGRRYIAGIASPHPSIDESLWYDDGNEPLPFGVMLQTLRRGNFDAVFVVHPTPRLAVLMFLARIPVRIGTGYRWYSWMFNRRVYSHRKTAARHELEYNLELLSQLDCPVPSPIVPEFGITVSSSARDGAWAALRRHGILEKEQYIVVHPSTGGSAREWPRDSFAALLRELVARYGFRVVLTGLAADSSGNERLRSAIGDAAVSVAGELSLQELGGVLEGARLLVVNSTGPLHLAVALGVPVLAFFPQIPVMGPGRWGPYTTRSRVLVPERPIDCRLCRKTGGGSCACMESISVERAARAAEELLGIPSR
jgi:heptosyltransferase-3